MATQPTNKPIGSEDPRDLKFNAGKVDEWATSTESEYTDRKGVKRLTADGMQQIFNDSQEDKEERFNNFLLNSGYQFLGDYELGPWQFSERNQYIRYDGQYWRLAANAPQDFATTGITMATFEVDKLSLVVMDGDSLREEIKENNGDMVGYRNPITNAVHRSLKSKLSEGVSVKDFGLIGDGIADDTAKFRLAVLTANTMAFDLYVPTMCKIRLTGACDLPIHGIRGGGRTSSKIILDIMTLPTGTSALTYGKEDDWNSHGGIYDLFITVANEDSTINLVEIKTPSRGTVLRDCTIHVGYGTGLVFNFAYYITYDNVVVEGKYISKENVTSANPLRGNGFRWPSNQEINNITFIKCEFKFLASVAQGGDYFTGSNTILFLGGSAESIGDSFGSLKGMFVTFESMYFEGFGHNKHNWSNITEIFAQTGSGNAVFRHCMFNMSDANPNQDMFTSVVGAVDVYKCTLVKPSGFTGNIIKPITYSTRGKLISVDSPGFDDFVPAYRAIPQQRVGGYANAGAGKLTQQVVASSVGDYSLEFLAYKTAGTTEYVQRPVCELQLRTVDSYMITVETTTSGRINTSGSTGIIRQTSSFFRSASTAVETIPGRTVTSMSDPNTIFDGSWSTPLVVFANSGVDGNYQRVTIQLAPHAVTANPMSYTVQMRVIVVPLSAQTGAIGITPIIN